jgi:hypothetical protein
VPVTLNPEPGETIVRLKVPTDVVGPGGARLDVEALPPLFVGDLPEFIERSNPDAPPAKLTPPLVFNGRIDPRSDEDRFIVIASPGERLRIDLAAQSLGSALAPGLEVRDARGNALPVASGRTIAAPDGVPEYANSDASAEFTVPDGRSFVTVTVRGGWAEQPPADALRTSARGGSGHAYRVTVIPGRPRFSIALNDAQISIPKGGTAAVGVTVTRDGFQGPIALRVVDPPAGLSVHPGKIADGQTVGAFTLTAAPDATFASAVLKVLGEGQGPHGPITAQATKVIFFGEPTTMPFRTVIDRVDDKPVYANDPAYLRTTLQKQLGLFAATIKPAPLRLDGPSAPVPVVRGSSARFRVTVTRSTGASGSLTLSPLALPPDLAIPDVTLDESATTATVSVSVAKAHPFGDVTVVLKARGHVAGAWQELTVPAVTLHVIGPGDIETAPDSKR